MQPGDEINPFAAPVAVDESDHAPRETGDRVDLSAFGTAATGLTLLRASVAIFAIAMLVLLLAIAVGGSVRPGSAAHRMVQSLYGLAVLASVILWFTGKIMGLSVPGSSTAKCLMGVSLGFDILGFVMIGVMILGLSSFEPRFMFVGMYYWIPWLIAGLLLFHYLKTLARLIEREDLAGRAQLLITPSYISGSLLIGLLVFARLLAAARGPSAAQLLGIFSGLVGISVFVIMMVMLIAFLSVVGRLRKAIKRPPLPPPPYELVPMSEEANRGY